MGWTARSEAEFARFQGFWRDETATARLYRDLADRVDDDRRATLLELADTEERHAEHWVGLLAAAGREPTPTRRRFRHHVLVQLAGWFGADRVLPAVVRAEAGDRDRYRAESHAPPGMADEEAEHARRFGAGHSWRCWVRADDG